MQFQPAQARLLTPPMPKDITLRVAQQAFCACSDACLGLAKRLVRVKILNSLELLKQSNWNEVGGDHRKARRRLTAAARDDGDAPSSGALNGVECAAARISFEGFSSLFKVSDLGFTGRTRRPPRDPVNALLSFF